MSFEQRTIREIQDTFSNAKDSEISIEQNTYKLYLEFDSIKFIIETSEKWGNNIFIINKISNVDSQSNEIKRDLTLNEIIKNINNSI